MKKHYTAFRLKGETKMYNPHRDLIHVTVPLIIEAFEMAQLQVPEEEQPALGELIEKISEIFNDAKRAINPFVVLKELQEGLSHNKYLPLITKCITISLFTHYITGVRESVNSKERSPD